MTDSPEVHDDPPVSTDAPNTAPATDGMAITALVLAVLSWVLLPVLLAIVALVVAKSASQSIAASGGTISRAGFTKAARVIAWLNLIFWGLLIVFGVAFAVGLAIGN